MLTFRIQIDSDGGYILETSIDGKVIDCDGGLTWYGVESLIKIATAKHLGPIAE